MDQTSEAPVEQKLAQTPEAQRLLRERTFHRVAFALGLVIVLSIILVWLPGPLRRLFLSNMAANRVLIACLCLFGLVASSLLWSRGQRIDVWLFNAMNLRGYHSTWMDRAMWVCTQIGNMRFTALLAIVAYLLGHRGFAFALGLGSLTLWLLVTVIKTVTDRARPFNLLQGTRVIGLHEPGLSFPSGHTAQTFYTATLVISYFHLPVGIALLIYGITVLVGFTRVYLGVHYPRDVIAGAILAGLCTWSDEK